jgi:hypothetical protein
MVGVERIAEHGRVGVRVRARGQDLANDPEVARIHVAGEHGLLERRVRETRERAGECRVLHQVGAGDLGAGDVIEHADPCGQLAVAVDDVVRAATRDGVAPSPR